MNEISKKSSGVFAHAQGFVLIADVIELGEYKGLRSVLFIPTLSYVGEHMGAHSVCSES